MVELFDLMVIAVRAVTTRCLYRVMDSDSSRIADVVGGQSPFVEQFPSTKRDSHSKQDGLPWPPMIWTSKTGVARTSVFALSKTRRHVRRNLTLPSCFPQIRIARARLSAVGGDVDLVGQIASRRSSWIGLDLSSFQTGFAFRHSYAGWKGGYSPHLRCTGVSDERSALGRRPTAGETGGRVMMGFVFRHGGEKRLKHWLGVFRFPLWFGFAWKFTAHFHHWGGVRNQ